MNKDFDVIVLNSHGVGQFCNIKRLPFLGETLRAWNWRVEEDGGKEGHGRNDVENQRMAHEGNIFFDPEKFHEIL